MISSSDDNTIKVWKIRNDSLMLVGTLEGHEGSVCQVIPLMNDIIASASKDKTIRIWNVNEHEQKYVLQEDFIVFSLLKLKNKGVFVSGGYGKEISFWEMETFTKENSVQCCDCCSLNGLIELPKHYIAVSGGLAKSIDIIDTDNYQLFKQIKCDNFIFGNSGISVYYSSLCLLDNKSFIYSHNGYFCQVSSTENEILFTDKMEDTFEGANIIYSSNGKYIIGNNKQKGISIYKVGFV